MPLGDALLLIEDRVLVDVSGVLLGGAAEDGASDL